MFRDFSFDPASPPAYSRYEADRAAMNVSPTSTRLPQPARAATPPCTMGDLAVQLRQQSLRIDTALAARACGPPTPPSDDCASPTDRCLARPTYSRVAASLVRMQRQTSSRMHCCPSHVRDLSRLVQMIQSQDQCTINHRASSRTSSTSSASSTSTSAGPSLAAPGDDEGIGMDYDVSLHPIDALARLPAWRAGDRRDACIRVPKPVRMRKRVRGSGICKTRSS